MSTDGTSPAKPTTGWPPPRPPTGLAPRPRATATGRPVNAVRPACAAWRPRALPCRRCPWSRSTPPGEFPLSRYRALRDTVGAPGREVPIGGPIFACHKTAEGREQPCTGWLAAVGTHHLGVRLAVVTGRLHPQALHPGPDWPALFTDYDELVRIQAGPG